MPLQNTKDLTFFCLSLSSITGKNSPLIRSLVFEITFGCLSKLFGVNNTRGFLNFVESCLLRIWNKFEGVVKESHIYTPVGKIKTPGNLEGEKVVVHIRPQGIKLNKQPTPVNGIKGTVMASKLMGSFSFIHLSVLDNNNEVVHVHSHMPADFNPKQSSAVEIEIDNDQAYIFKN